MHAAFALGVVIPSANAAFGPDPRYLASPPVPGLSTVATLLDEMALGSNVTIAPAVETLLDWIVSVELLAYM